mgnify:FL=1
MSKPPQWLLFRPVNFLVSLQFCALVVPLPVALQATPTVMLSIVLAFSDLVDKTVKKISRIVLLLYIASIISILFSGVYSSVPQKSFWLASYFLPGIVLILVAILTSKESRIRETCEVSILTAAGILCAQILWAGFEIRGDPQKLINGLGILGISVPNDILIAVMALPFCVGGLLEPGVSRQFKFGHAVLSVMILAASAIVQSRMAIGAALVIALAYLIQQRLRIRLVVIVATGIGLFLTLLNLVDADFLGKVKSFSINNERLYVWYVSLVSADFSPFIGVGHGTFDTFFEKARLAVEVPDFLHEDPRRMGWAHNLFVEALVERGILGLLLTAALMGSIGTAIWRLRSIRYSWCISFLVFFLASIVELTLVRPWVCFLLSAYCVIAIASISADKAKAVP